MTKIYWPDFIFRDFSVEFYDLEMFVSCLHDTQKKRK